MNPEYTTARADEPALASASAPDGTPMPASPTSGSPLGTTHYLTLAAAKKAADAATSSALAKGYPSRSPWSTVTASSSPSSVPTPPPAPRYR
jgi:hypothetical protein